MRSTSHFDWGVFLFSTGLILSLSFLVLAAFPLVTCPECDGGGVRLGPLVKYGDLETREIIGGRCPKKISLFKKWWLGRVDSHE